MMMALANMQIVISRLLRSLRITKGPTRWLNGEPHRQRKNLLDRPDGHKRACTSQALHACSCQASAEHFQQCAEFPLLRNRGLGKPWRWASWAWWLRRRPTSHDSV